MRLRLFIALLVLPLISCASGPPALTEAQIKSDLEKVTGKTPKTAHVRAIHFKKVGPVFIDGGKASVVVNASHTIFRAESPELGEFETPTENLYLEFMLSQDNKWHLASVSDSKGNRQDVSMILD
jgi:hypothetical protein